MFLSIYLSILCTTRKAISNFELKADVQRGPLRFREKLTIDMIVSSNLPYFIQMTCVLRLYYFELYPMDGNLFNDLLVGN